MLLFCERRLLARKSKVLPKDLRLLEFFGMGILILVKFLMRNQFSYQKIV